MRKTNRGRLRTNGFSKTYSNELGERSDVGHSSLDDSINAQNVSLSEEDALEDEWLTSINLRVTLKFKYSRPTLTRDQRYKRFIVLKPSTTAN